MKCRNCLNEIIPVKKPFSWLIFLLLLLMGGVGGVIYLLYHLTKSLNRCPICKKKI